MRCDDMLRFDPSLATGMSHVRHAGGFSRPADLPPKRYLFDNTQNLPALIVYRSWG